MGLSKAKNNQIHQFELPVISTFYQQPQRKTDQKFHQILKKTIYKPLTLILLEKDLYFCSLN